MRRLLAMLVIGAIGVAQPGCAHVAKEVAVEGGKRTYTKVKEKRAEQQASDAEGASNEANK